MSNEVNEFWKQSMQDITQLLGYLEPIYSRLGAVNDKLDTIIDYLKDIENK